MKNNFQIRLKTAMEERKIKAADLARKAELSKAQISQYVNGVHIAKPDALSKLAVALNVSEGWLMGYDVPKDRESAPPDELTALLEEIRNDPQKRALFSLAKDATVDDVRQAVAILDALRRARGGSGE